MQTDASCNIQQCCGRLHGALDRVDRCKTNTSPEYCRFLPIFFKDADSRAESARKNQVMVAHPRQASLPLCSLIVTLYYCCRYHFGEPEVKGIFVSTVLGIAYYGMRHKYIKESMIS